MKGNFWKGYIGLNLVSIHAKNKKKLYLNVEDLPVRGKVRIIIFLNL